MATYGYAPQILEVDLSRDTVTKVPVDLALMRRWVGGMGFAVKTLYDRIGRGVDALSSENLLIVAAAPLVGTLAPCSCRVEVIGKSPLTGLLGAASGGGHWAPALKYAGYEAIVFSGQSPRPVYLWIDDDIVELRDASSLWGRETWDTVDWLRRQAPETYGDRLRVMSIGPAGENQVRFASITVDYQNSASRSGVGAIMGAKRLKAIAVRGSGGVKVALPEELMSLTREYVSQGDPGLLGRRDLPPAYLVTRALNHPRLRESGLQPGRNWQTGVLPHWEKRTLKEGMRYVRRPAGESCHACHASDGCLEVKTGRYAGTKVGDAHMQPIQSFGANCAIEDLDAIFYCQELSERLGMDYIEVASTIAFAMELYQRGLLTREDTEGLDLKWGHAEAVITLMNQIARREGLGNILAEGSLRAGQKLGGEAVRYSMTVAGMTPDVVEQQRVGLTAVNLGVLSSPRGGCNVRTTHAAAMWERTPGLRPPGTEKMNQEEYSRWWIEQLDMPASLKKRIYGQPPRLGPYTDEQRALIVKWAEELTTLENCLGVCMTARLTPTLLSRLYTAVTGWSTTPEELVAAGERVFNLAWAYNAREGASRAQVDFPERFYAEPLPEGPFKGARLSREEVNRARDAYFAGRGWNLEKGLPSAKKLRELGLAEVATDLEGLSL